MQAMPLTPREKAVAIISNGIAVYSLLQERDGLQAGTTMYDFIIKALPEELKPELTGKLVDEVFEYVSAAHSS